MRIARSVFGPGIGALVLGLLAAACSDDTTPPPSDLPPLELQILEPDPTAGPVRAGETVRFRGEARAEDMGNLAEDSVWWTLDGQELGRGYTAEAVVPEGEHDFGFHARIGRRSGVAPRSIVAEPPPAAEPGDVLWSVSVGEGEGFPLLSMGPEGTLYTVANGRSLVALWSGDGSELWRTEVPMGVSVTSPPAISLGGDVYLGGACFGEAGLIAFALGGGVRWVLRGDDHFPGESTYGYTAGGVAVDEAGMLYLGSSDDRASFLKVDPQGTVRWTAVAPDSVRYGLWSGPVLTSGNVVMMERKRDLVAWDQATGEEAWRVRVWPEHPRGVSGAHNFPAVLSDGTLVFRRDRFLWAVTPDGEVGWKTELLDGLFGDGTTAQGGPAVSLDRIFLQNAEGGLEVFSLSGQPLEAWRPSLEWVYRGTPVLGAGGVVYVMGSPHPEGSGYLKSYAPGGTLRWEIELFDHEANNFIDSGSPIIGDDGTLYLRTSGGRVVAVADTVGPAINAQWPELRGGPARWGRRQQR